MEVFIANLIYNAFGDMPLGGDDPKTLREAKDSPELSGLNRATAVSLEGQVSIRLQMDCSPVHQQ